jgi:hypothetical protein
VAVLAKPLILLAAAELMLAMPFVFNDPFDKGIADTGMGSRARDLGRDECEMDGIVGWSSVLLEYLNALQLRGINEIWMLADSQGTIGIHSSKGDLSIELNYVTTTFRTE